MILPMLATPGTHVPVGEEWVHEVKWDGVRMLAEVPAPSDGTANAVRLTTRNGNDATRAWPEIAADVGRSTGSGDRGWHDLVVDGEVIALNASGRPDFRRLAERMHIRDVRKAARLAAVDPATYLVFDLIRLGGRDVTGLPWSERRALLESLDLGGWQVPAVYDDGPLLHRVTREQGLEGTVSKRRAALYRPGERSRDWVKLAHRSRGSYVVGGWRPQVGTLDRLAALLVGEVTPAGLAYRGRVGSGIGAKASRMLREMLTEAPTSPFADEVPREDATGCHWVEPLLVVDVESHGLGYDRLRQPAFVGVRADLSPTDLEER